MTNQNNLKGKRVLIFQQRGWSIHIGHFLAKKLQDDGCRLAALTMKKGTHNFTLRQKDVSYDLVISNDEVISDPKKYLGDDNYTIEEICETLRIESIWPLASSLRNHVKSYGGKYYYSFRQNVSDDEILNYIKAIYKYINIFFKEFKPDLIICPNFTEASHIMFNLYAKNKGVRMLALTDCKIRDVMLVTYDYLNTTGPFYDRVEELNAKKVQSENAEKARTYIKEFREKFIPPSYSDRKEDTSLIKMIRKELAPYRAIFRWYTKKRGNYIPSLGIMKDYKPPRIQLRDHYLDKRYRKFANSYSYFPIDSVGKYIYFPLQYQPEETIDVQGIYFSNQIETARLCAMSLPGEYTLVVKDHPAMLGKRNPSYLEKLSATPNVKLVDYRVPTEKVIKGAALLISPNSTTVAEAAFYNTAAIQLGMLGTTLKLPNVFQHTEIPTLAKKIKEVMEIDLQTSEYERRLENYVAATYDTGLESRYMELWERNVDEDMDMLWSYYKNEIIQAL